MVPANLKTQVNILPNTPGVYIFYGNNKHPLYIGKSINIKKRVTSHFTKQSIHKSLYEQIIKIKGIETASELGALIKESHLIKNLYPIYNKKLRKVKNFFYIQQTYSENKYKQIEIVQANNLTIKDKVLGIYKNKRTLKQDLQKKAHDFCLCQKLLKLQAVSGACFYCQLNICKGACINKEDYKKYNRRFNKAFYDNAIKNWPYKGPIIISQMNGNSKDTFKVFNWKIIEGKYYQNNKCIEIITQNDFNYDIYKILTSFILTKKGVTISSI